jgi:signal transduction histidine kinase
MTHDLEPPLLMRMRPAFQLIGDLMIAVVLAVVAGLAAQIPSEEGFGPLPVIAGLAMGLPMAVRRRWPCSVLAVVAGTSVLVIAAGWVPPHAAVVPDLLFVFAIYPVAVTAPACRATVALVLSAGGICAAVLFAVAMEPKPNWGRSLPLLGTQMIIPVGVWVVGRAVRARRGYESRAVQQVLTDERLRIARDLHDGVAHCLSVITVQASVAVHVADERGR